MASDKVKKTCTRIKRWLKNEFREAGILLLQFSVRASSNDGIQASRNQEKYQLQNHRQRLKRTRKNMICKTRDRVKVKSISGANHTNLETVKLFLKKDRDPFVLRVSTLLKRVRTTLRQFKWKYSKPRTTLHYEYHLEVEIQNRKMK